MSSLYKRATPRQARLLRMIEGACRNAAHAHPGRPLDDKLARGIAKRAAGTISAGWPDVLAMPAAWSEGEPDQFCSPAAGDGRQLRTAGTRSIGSQRQIRSRGTPHGSWRAPLRHLHRAIGNATGEAARNGQTEREEAFKDVLRLIARLIAEPVPPRPRTKLTVGRQ